MLTKNCSMYLFERVPIIDAQRPSRRRERMCVFNELNSNLYLDSNGKSLRKLIIPS